MKDVRLAQLNTFKADQAAALSDAQHNIAHDLPQPASPSLYCLLIIGVLILVVAVAFYRRTNIARWWRRWVTQPITRKSSRNGAALKQWWLEK